MPAPHIRQKTDESSHAIAIGVWKVSASSRVQSPSRTNGNNRTMIVVGFMAFDAT
jgi:hypothetical protein